MRIVDEVRRLDESEGAARRSGWGLVTWAVVLCAAAITGRRLGWEGGPGLALTLGATTTVLVLCAGVLALARRRADGDYRVLLLGAGLVGATGLLALDTLACSPLAIGTSLGGADWTWGAAWTFLGVLFLTAAVAPGRPLSVGPGPVPVAAVVCLGVVAAAAGCVTLFLQTPALSGLHPERVLARPGELVSGALLLAALTVQLVRGEWRSDSVAASVVLALLTAAIAQIVFRSRSSADFDTMHTAARALGVVGAAVLFGGQVRGVVAALAGADAALLRRSDDLQATRTAAVILMQDISRARRRAEQAERDLSHANGELIRSNQELDEFAYVASHDLKEPLRGIQSYANFMLADYAGKLDAEAEVRLRAIDRLARRSESFIESLLEYSRVGNAALAFQRVVLAEVLEQILDSLHVAISEQGVTVRVSGSLPSLTCDQVRVGEIFRNLITNALKYNDKSERWIEIGVDPDAGGAGLPGGEPNDPVFFVRDNGIGIQQRHTETIFQIFRRLHGQDRYGGGTGAGLTIARRIVERHGGRIWVESVVGEGTTFYFTLPDGGKTGQATECAAAGVPAR